MSLVLLVLPPPSSFPATPARSALGTHVLSKRTTREHVHGKGAWLQSCVGEGSTIETAPNS